MKIDIKEIEKITTYLLNKFQESNGAVYELKSDFYWDISSEEIYNPYDEPKNITLGQLSDDLVEIQRLSKCDDGNVYDLKRLASILKALSIENPTAF